MDVGADLDASLDLLRAIRRMPVRFGGPLDLGLLARNVGLEPWQLDAMIDGEEPGLEESYQASMLCAYAHVIAESLHSRVVNLAHMFSMRHH